jgi:pimeloyl-ACP methyl ester carboxylesterase
MGAERQGQSNPQKAGSARTMSAERLNKTLGTGETMQPTSTLARWRLAIIGVALIACGGLLAHLTQTTGGIKVQDIRFKGAKGNTMSALLYIPPTATAAKPAPGILAVHGYINSRETQSGFAIEFARRGYVVLALDQTGHGYSDPPAFANGFGGPDGLVYLRSLAFVDKTNIGLEGHSMGGWTVLAAATAMPNDYKAMVLEGSSTGKPFAADGTPTWPRNLALVFAQYEEFPQLMWGVARAKDVVTSPKLLSLFGTTGTVQPGKVYGDIAQGTARVLYTPPITHPAEHISHVAIGHAIDWFSKTLQGAEPIPATQQIWFRKEFGTLVAFAGFIVLLLGAFQLLLGLPAFSHLALPVPVDSTAPTPAPRDRAWWRTLWLTALVPAILYYPVLALAANVVKASPYLPQSITNQIAAWAVINAILTLVLLWFAPRRATRMGIVFPSILIAIATVAIGYLSLVVADLVFKIDFRFWIVALKLMNGKQGLMFLIYLLPFTVFFVVAFRSIHHNLYRPGESAVATTFTCMAALALGFLILCIVQYGALWIDGKLIDAFPTVIGSVSLNTIIATQFLPLLAILGVIAAFTIRKTGTSLPGALICALFITWYIVAGQATQAPF